jgi:Homeodomain-like domain
LRRQGLDSDGVAHAVRLYDDGWSVARIGDRLGVDATTAWTAIKTQGTHIRDTHGREQ